MKTLSRGIPALLVTGSLMATGVAGAAASVPSVAEQAAADLENSQVLDEAAREAINEDLTAVGQETLTADAHALGFNAEGDAVVVLDDGSEVQLASAESMEEEMAVASTAEAGIESGAQTQSSSKGALGGIASTIAGCTGGVIGFDAIVSILEKRVSYWALVKFIGGKIGPGLAISCVAGAGGALAVYMGW